MSARVDSGMLIRRAKEGGSYHVRVNLTRCAMWFMSLGMLDCYAIQAVGKSTNFWNRTRSRQTLPMARWSAWPRR